MEMEPKPEMVRAGQVMTRTHQRAITELLDCFSPADAMHTKYPLEPIRIYRTKPEIEQFLGLIRITEIGESQKMMEIVQNQYLTNLHDINTDIERMDMDPEFRYQQHTLDSDAHHLNRHMIDIVQKYMRGDGPNAFPFPQFERCLIGLMGGGLKPKGP